MSRTVAYLPAPGTAADRAYAHLLSLAGAEISGPLLCETARLPQGTLGPSMAPLLARAGRPRARQVAAQRQRRYSRCSGVCTLGFNINRRTR